MVRTRLNIGCRYSTPVRERPLHPTRGHFTPEPSQTQAPVTPATEPERRAGGSLTTVWEEIALSDDEEAASIGMIVALNHFHYGRSELTEEAADEFDRLAPGMIPEFVRTLNAWTKSRQPGKRGRVPAGFPAVVGFQDPPTFRRKVGRNEPCRCGSGRKYKLCCGAH